MNAEQLSRVGEKLVKRCGSRDPFEIARQLGINVMLCENFGSLKGMYRVIKRNRFIFLIISSFSFIGFLSTFSYQILNIQYYYIYHIIEIPFVT